MTTTTHTIDLATGVTLPYRVQGDPDATPVVLLHGYSDSARSYDLLLPHLPAGVRAFAVTQRGHADAGKPAGGYRQEDYVADVAAFLDAVGLDAAVVVGHSAGSYTAQRFAVEHPERTLALGLIGAFRAFAGNAAVAELQEAVAGLGDPVDPGFVREFQESCVARRVPADFLDAIIAGSCQMPYRVWRDCLEGLVQAPVPTEVGPIAAPTLIQWGDQDAFCPRSDQDALLAAVPSARLEVHRGVGHCPHWEQPERAAAELVALVDQVSGVRV